MDVFSAIMLVVPLIGRSPPRLGSIPFSSGSSFCPTSNWDLTPPVGMNLCLSACRFQRPMASVYRATLPSCLMLPAAVLPIAYVPWITMAPCTGL